jgi:TonB family protein
MKDMSRYLAASLMLIHITLPSLGQVTRSSGRVIADKMEIPRYPGLARQAWISAEVTLRLRMKKNGDVVSVTVVHAHAERGYGVSGFIDTATDAAKVSRFSCPTCEGATFEQTVTYEFQCPPQPEHACTQTIPPPPPSTTESPSHVTVRPAMWSCVWP